jgi:hypothetical protein
VHAFVGAALSSLHAPIGAAAVAPDRAGSGRSSLSILSGRWGRSWQKPIYWRGLLASGELLRSASWLCSPCNDGAALLPSLLLPTLPTTDLSGAHHRDCCSRKMTRQPLSSARTLLWLWKKATKRGEVKVQLAGGCALCLFCGDRQILTGWCSCLAADPSP